MRNHQTWRKEHQNSSANRFKFEFRITICNRIYENFCIYFAFTFKANQGIVYQTIQFNVFHCEMRSQEVHLLLLWDRRKFSAVRMEKRSCMQRTYKCIQDIRNWTALLNKRYALPCYADQSSN